MQPRLGMAAFIVACRCRGRRHPHLGDPPPHPRRAALLRPARAASAAASSGVAALSDGFIALQAGDAARARAARPRGAQQPAAQRRGATARSPRRPRARRHAVGPRALSGADLQPARPPLAALAGLYDQARTQGRTDAALTFAQKAAALAPQPAGPVDAVLDDLTRRGQWD